MLQLKKNTQAFVPCVSSRVVEAMGPANLTRRCRTLGDRCSSEAGCSVARQSDVCQISALPGNQPDLAPSTHPNEIDPLFLFACHIEWEEREEPSAGWELIAAAQSSHSDTCAHARALLSSSRHLGGVGECGAQKRRQSKEKEEEEKDEMNAPYGLDIIEDCAECGEIRAGHFCDFSQPALESLNEVSQKSVLPAGAILFVEGQAPRGMFIVCSGKVNLSTTSREGKILIVKTAGPGEGLGLSAAVSGITYETTAETATPCHLNFIERKDFLELMQNHPELGMHTAQCLSRDYRSAYRDIHDLVLTRSSKGKLARLLLTESVREGTEAAAGVKPTPMTHEEMAMRIGASRETVTRLLTTLRRKRLIRLDGPALVIRDRPGLEALAV